MLVLTRNLEAELPHNTETVPILLLAAARISTFKQEVNKLCKYS